MTPKAKSNSVITTRIEGSRIFFTVLGAGELVLDMSKMHEAMRMQACGHGMIQRVSDGAAIPCDPETGLPATPQEKFDAMKRLVDHYESGTDQWRLVVAAGERSGGLLFEALRRERPDADAETLRTFIKGLSKADQAALLASEELAPHVTAIRAAAGKGRDVSGMLSALKSL